MDHWFHGDGGISPEDQAYRLKQAEELGIDPAVLPQYEDRRSDFDLWPEHWQAVEMFLAVQTQWRSSGAGVIGLDYKVILDLCVVYQVIDVKRLMQDIQVMEIHARSLINKGSGQ